MESLYFFNTDKKTELKEVGGKALSLILMTGQQLPVPPGFVLTVKFFEPWFAELKQTTEWKAVMSTKGEEFKRATESLKALCKGLKLNDEQKDVLKKAYKELGEKYNTTACAVRSSSPEEDLEGASFAGAYETVLGVTGSNILDAIRTCFASTLDERVFLYKLEHGFTIEDPKIAVIVQKQIESDTAGVAFTMNPLNNCFDEVVINANYGQGESVVSGIVSPDKIVINKHSKEFLEKKPGKKETSIWLKKGGGTFEERRGDESRLCLRDNELHKLVNMLNSVEAYYGKPMDTEWAFENGILYLLQGRPITAYIPLPKTMQTRPDEPRRLYMDMTLVKQGIQEPFTVMGTEFFGVTQRLFLKDMFGQEMIGVEDGYAFNDGGRSYVHLSNAIKMQGKKMMAKMMHSADTMTAEIINNINTEDYVPKKLPKKLKGALLKMIFNNLKSVSTIMKAYKKPAQYREYFIKEKDNYLKELKTIGKKNISHQQMAEELVNWYIKFITELSLPMTYSSEIARAGLKKPFKAASPAIKEKLNLLERALPHNITIEMGFAMYRLANYKEIKECSNANEFAAKLKAASFSRDFTNAWNGYIRDYGFRCPRELDLATKRPNESVEATFEQVKGMAGNEESSPIAIFEKAKKGREETFEELYSILRSKSKGKAKKFKRSYEVFCEFGGYRELHKYYLIMLTDMLRKKILKSASKLVENGRLDEINEVFSLTLSELDRGVKSSSIDLRTTVKANTIFLNKIKNINNFPRVIDSRGKILQAPRREAGENELAGEPISNGVIRGKVKVLNTPDEKPLLPGEILVARATDPGWTPLFINAGAVVLEIGGLFQHGALVAREYGKACVAGIENATTELKDGQLIEVDGANGIIKLL